MKIYKLNKSQNLTIKKINNDILLLTHKNSYSNSIGGDTTITNNNNNLSENNFNEIFGKKSKKKI